VGCVLLPGPFVLLAVAVAEKAVPRVGGREGGREGGASGVVGLISGLCLASSSLRISRRCGSRESRICVCGEGGREGGWGEWGRFE